MLLLRGSIVFYWLYGSPPKVVARHARDAGIRSLAVKCGDSGVWWPQYRKLAPYLDIRGIERPAWAYNRPTTIDGDVRVAAAARAAGAPAFIADMEQEYMGQPLAARLYGRILRRRLGKDYPIYVTTFSSPLMQPNFPWAEVAEWADGLIPQWYACAYPGGNIRLEAEQSYPSVAALGKPVLPAVPLYGSTNEADVEEVARLGRHFNSKAILWWRFGTGTQRMLETAARMHVGDAGSTKRPRPERPASALYGARTHAAAAGPYEDPTAGMGR